MGVPLLEDVCYTPRRRVDSTGKENEPPKTRDKTILLLEIPKRAYNLSTLELNESLVIRF